MHSIPDTGIDSGVQYADSPTALSLNYFTLTLKNSVDDKVLHDHLFVLAKEYTPGMLKEKILMHQLKSYWKNSGLKTGQPLSQTNKISCGRYPTEGGSDRRFWYVIFFCEQ